MHMLIQHGHQVTSIFTEASDDIKHNTKFYRTIDLQWMLLSALPSKAEEKLSQKV